MRKITPGQILNVKPRPLQGWEPVTHCVCSPFWILNSLSSLNSHLAAYFLKVINCTFPLWKAAFPSSCWVFTFTLNLWFTKNNTGLHSPAEKVQISEPKLPINCQNTRSYSRTGFRVSCEICPQSLLNQLTLSFVLLGLQCGTCFHLPQLSYSQYLHWPAESSWW